MKKNYSKPAVCNKKVTLDAFFPAAVALVGGVAAGKMIASAFDSKGCTKIKNLQPVVF